MSHKEIDAKALSLLSADIALRDVWAVPPRAMHIPFMGSRGSFFLLISVFIATDQTDRVGLMEKCFSVAKLIVDSGILSDEKAIEVAGYTPHNGKSKRVIRLAVYQNAFEAVKKMHPHEFARENSIEGIKWSWPLDGTGESASA